MNYHYYTSICVLYYTCTYLTRTFPSTFSRKYRTCSNFINIIFNTTVLHDIWNYALVGPFIICEFLSVTVARYRASKSLIETVRASRACLHFLRWKRYGEGNRYGKNVQYARRASDLYARFGKSYRGIARGASPPLLLSSRKPRPIQRIHYISRIYMCHATIPRWPSTWHKARNNVGPRGYANPRDDLNVDSRSIT